MSERATDAAPHRRVTSFVHQRIRFTEGQAHAWDRLWPVYGRDVADVVSGVASYDPPAWFGRRAPLVLEIGSGTGESTESTACTTPLASTVIDPPVATGAIGSTTNAPPAGFFAK